MARGPILAMPDLGSVHRVVTELFMADTRRTHTGCLQWLGPVTRVGERRYPFFTWQGHNTTAARWAWHLTVEPLKAGQQLLRTCDNELCVEPKHHEIKAKRERAAVRPVEEPVESSGVVYPEEPATPLSVPPARTPGLTDRHLDFRLSHHARRRAQELGFAVNEVLLAAAEPEQSYVSAKRYGEDTYVHQRGDLAVAVHRPDRMVLTVLLRRQDEWTHGVDVR